MLMWNFFFPFLVGAAYSWVNRNKVLQHERLWVLQSSINLWP